MTVLSCAAPTASWSACAAACRRVPTLSAWAVVRPPAACWVTHSCNQSLSWGLARCSGGGAHAGEL
eukprot:25148-Lingulodinium_polyedra.AAC.1